MPEMTKKEFVAEEVDVVQEGAEVEQVWLVATFWTSRGSVCEVPIFC